MNNIALIAVAYNKVDSLLRLLHSLNVSEYDNEQIPLIISIDNSGTREVEEAAEKFHWLHGTKEIRTFEKRQGLKNHILSCGEYLKRYEAVYIFEDDILVSPFFYKYGKKCIERYKAVEDIEGISLYSPMWNQNANFPFEPMQAESDTYFMQYAQSWGQVWFRDRWEKFIAWYKKNEDFFEKEKNPQIPQILYTWGKKSWLKYHIAYCALEKKYFVYPYNSYTTTFVENGTHFIADITRYQVNLMMYDRKNLILADFDEKAIYYDAFFENMNLNEWIEKEYCDLQVDLYGCQLPDKVKRYIISSQKLPFKTVKEYGLQLRPIELNIYMKIEGKGIYLYDTHTCMKQKKTDIREQTVQKWNYFMKDRFILGKEIVPVCSQKFINLCRSIFRKGKVK